VFARARFDLGLTGTPPLARGSGDYDALMRMRVHDKERQYPGALERLVKARDPIANLDLLKNRFLCMINGTEDKLVPASCNQHLVACLAPLYEADLQPRLVLRLFPVGHTVNEAMFEAGLEYLAARCEDSRI
jgi:hypothetical protein